METRRRKSYTRFNAKSILLALVAVFAMSVVATAAASAAKPEFKPVPAKKKFTISGATSKWVAGSETITCTKVSVTGEIDSAQTVGNTVVTYSGCKSSGKVHANCPVNSTGAKEGEIVTNPLTGELGTVATSQATSGVGLRFKPESAKGAGWFDRQENDCTVGEEYVGQLAAEVSVTGKKQTTNELAFMFGSSGEKIKEITLDSGVLDKPEFEAFGRLWAFETSEELKFEEPVEVT